MLREGYSHKALEAKLHDFMVRHMGEEIAKRNAYHLHHAAQIGRECGVPSVALPDVALNSISDGSPISVDGTAGTVPLLQYRLALP